jgi:adenylosuccinate synthase
MTTPYDVFNNRRDNQNLNHGTCGLGIGKTMKRNEGPYKLYAIDLLNYDILCHKVEAIKDYYNASGDSYKNSYLGPNEKGEIVDFFNAIKEISWEIRDYDYLKSFDNLVFEGSQGILLDMDHGVFPNVTYSNTTSKNAHDILDKIGVTERSVYYVTRSYSTRHGSGPFIEEDIPVINNEEEINVTNSYQLNFKIASINYDLLNYALSIDKIYCNNRASNVSISSHLVVTCMDQLEGFSMDYHKFDGTRVFATIHESYSPDNKDFKKIWPPDETKNK